MRRAPSHLSIQERQDQLQKYIESAHSVNVSEICTRFQVSEATARRDLEELGGRGKIQRVHGGAISLKQAPPELPVYQRMNEQMDAKQRIGQAMAELIEDGETIFLGTGTTLLEVARNLDPHKNLTVITNSLLIMNQLLEKKNISLISLGGMFRRSELSFIGHIAEQAMAELRADKVVIGIRSLDPVHGLTSHYLPETMTDRKILQMGREIFVLADHTKLCRTSSAFVAPISTIQTLVTDAAAQPEFVQILILQGIQVICA
jgi:DeoR family transcriptional regulator of aga operon